MVKNTSKEAGQHKHCDRCFNLRCQVPEQIAVSCETVKCRRGCGAAFHLCKQDEHLLLCPNEPAPCLNAANGCPLTMQRRALAKHLEVCPASVVCCSQEWNRFPVSESERTFCGNVSGKAAEEEEADLDVALALRDQEVLFESIKMKKIFPELTADDPEPRAEEEEEEASRSFDGGEMTENGGAGVEEKELSQEERDALAKSSDVTSAQNFNSWEKIFNKEKRGCEQTVKSQPKEEKETEESCERRSRRDSSQAEDGGQAGASGFAPWTDGVLEKLGREFNIADYNMYLAHNGVMLINFGQLAACTPREKDFVYGNLEPIQVKSIRTFSVPKSYRAKRSALKDPTRKTAVSHRSVDTADLGVALEDLPQSEEIGATLLCCLERELKGHSISESSSTDGYYVDVGTQTYRFASAPFRADATLADVAAARPRGLHMRLEAESVTRRHNRASSAFSYVCGRFFRRDEYRSHFRNVHCDIQAPLNGWFQQRCPLAYLGCTFSQPRFRPAGQQGTAVKFCQDVSAFTLRPQAPPSAGGPHPGNADPLSALPLEVLQHVAGYLDSLALSQLSRVSRPMREACATLLQERGMVSLKWERKTDSTGKTSWRCQKKVWRFSSVFSSVDRWSFADAPPMSAHLQACPFYRRERREDPVALACLGEVREQLRS